MNERIGERDAAQVPRDASLLRDGGAVLPQLLHLLLPVGAVHRGRIEPAVRLEGLREAPGLPASEQVMCVGMIPIVIVVVPPPTVSLGQGASQ